jgi:hypothetical protein
MWTFYNSSGQKLSTAATSIDVLDIDGATDIGAAIVDADLFIIDDGAGGTNRKTEASRLQTYTTVSVKVGSFTRDTATATGTQAITGVGFQPKAVIFTGAKNGTESVVYCSFTDGTTDGQTYSREEETAGNRTSNIDLFQFHQSGSGNYNSAGLTLDSDGFTISWTKAGTNSGTITAQYLAIR